MPRPIEGTEWATTQLDETIKNTKGEAVLVSNREEPSISSKLSGFRARTKVARAYINYMFYAIHKHLTWITEGDVGDIKFFPTTKTEAEVEADYGGNWTLLGTMAVSGGPSLNVFQKSS